MWRTVIVALFAAFWHFTGTAAATSSRLDVRLDVAEAEAALVILERQHNGLRPRAQDWRRLFASEGYRRLKQREAAMGRGFEDSDFRAFLTDPDQVARAPWLRRTLNEWAQMSVETAAGMAFAYLPEDAEIRATVYITIKPRTNSFVFDLSGEPAIFLYLNPQEGAVKTANIVTHEFHHIGFASVCPRDEPGEEAAESPAHERLLMWLGSFGEGFAMLAAAGGVDVHPHAVSSPEERARWDDDMTRVRENMADQSAFFTRVLDGELTDIEAIDAQARSYFGVQGAWYSVGWMMATTIERAFGRQALIDTMCRPTGLLARYNDAARAEAARLGGTPLLWDEALARRLSQ